MVQIFTDGLGRVWTDWQVILLFRYVVDVVGLLVVVTLAVSFASSSTDKCLAALAWHMQNFPPG